MRSRFDQFSFTAGVCVALLVLCFGAWFGIGKIFFAIVFDPSLPALSRVSFARSLLFGAFTDKPLVELAYLVSVAVLIGVNATLTSTYIRTYRKLETSYGISSGLLGLVSAVLGFGCAACGSLGAGWALASVGAGSLIAALPFGGIELRVSALALLALSSYFMIRELRRAQSYMKSSKS